MSASFDKTQPMALIECGNPPEGATWDSQIVFALVYKRIGLRRRYYVVFQQGADEEKTRFFFTNSGARTYYEYLIGNRPAPCDVNRWGSKTLENLESLLTLKNLHRGLDMANQTYDYLVLYQRLEKLGLPTRLVNHFTLTHLTVKYDILSKSVVVYTNYETNRKALEFFADGSAWIIRPLLLDKAIEAIQQVITQLEDKQ